MTEKEKRQELFAKGKELGLSFANNAKTEKMENDVRDEEDRLAIAESQIKDTEVDDDLVIDDDDIAVEEEEVITDEVGVENAETAMRLRLEKEFEAKLEEKAEEIRATYARNEAVDAGGSSLGLIKLKAQKKATKLIRCIVTNRNPLKQSWEGEIITVSNDLIGMQRKYVPFSLQEGYHLPQIMVDTLKDKECTVFVNAKTKNGEKVKVGKLIKEYGIEILPPLTQLEIASLATEQRARGSIDD